MLAFTYLHKCKLSFQKNKYGFRTRSFLDIMNNTDQPQHEISRSNSTSFVSPTDHNTEQKEEEEESSNRDISIQAGDPAIKMVRFSLDKQQSQKKSSKMRPNVRLLFFVLQFFLSSLLTLIAMIETNQSYFLWNLCYFYSFDLDDQVQQFNFKY